MTLRSYRVFGKNAPEASNFDILKALDRAVSDGCDLVNMSLGSQGAVDAATHDAISNARANGTLGQAVFNTSARLGQPLGVRRLPPHERAPEHDAAPGVGTVTPLCRIGRER